MKTKARDQTFLSDQKINSDFWKKIQKIEESVYCDWNCDGRHWTGNKQDYFVNIVSDNLKKSSWSSKTLTWNDCYFLMTAVCRSVYWAILFLKIKREKERFVGISQVRQGARLNFKWLLLLDNHNIFAPASS